eukprot:COSAG01_NODE_73145_length_251_cov_0.644737_2_plen_28_part_01
MHYHTDGWEFHKSLPVYLHLSLSLSLND